MSHLKHSIANILGLQVDENQNDPASSPPILDGPYLEEEIIDKEDTETALTVQTSSSHAIPARMIGGGRKKGRRQKKSVTPPKIEENPLNKILDPESYSREHFTCVSAAQASGGGRFDAYRFIARFSLHMLYRAPYPDEELKQIFRICLEKAKAEAMQQLGLHPNHYFVCVQSEALDSDINNSLKNIDESSLEELLSLFEKIDQSNRAKGRDSICEGLFTVDVMAAQTKGRRGKKRKLTGAGRKNMREFQYNVHEGTLYDHPDFPYGLCLFFALEWIRQKYLLTRDAYRRWRENPARQMKTVRETMAACMIEEDLHAYSLYEHGQTIQEYYNEINPNLFRIFCFGSFGMDFKPTYKTEVECYEMPIVLLYDEEEEHFEPVKSPGRLFMEDGLYCYPCEKPYKKKGRHSCSCKGRCINCQNVHLYPCKSDGKFWKTCLNCCKTFNNQECYNMHLYRRGKTRNVCERSKKCPDCGVVYMLEKKANDRVNKIENDRESSVTLGSEDTEDSESIDDIDDEERESNYERDEHLNNYDVATGKGSSEKNFRKKQKPVHVCGERWCRKCKNRHLPSRPCWIISRPRALKDRRIIVYDFEASQHIKPDPTLPRFKHQINFAFAHVMCYRCLKNRSWNEPLEKPCVICGKNRTFSWASFDYEGSDQHVHTHVEKDDDILPDFVNWLLHFEEENIDDQKAKRDKRASGKKNSRFETICYAHNGSRYDHVFVFGEIIRAGGLRPTIIRQGNTLLEMKIKKPGIITKTIFRDTLKIIPIGLGKFVKTFDLKIPNVSGKKYFPYKFSVPENYHKEMQCLPEKEYYSPGCMYPEERENFLNWHNENQKTPFCLKNVLADYCISDVQILVNGLVKMRSIFMEITGRDITEATTLPTALMSYFVSSLAEHDSDNENKKNKRLWVALTPHLGYDRHDHQSLLARNYLKYWSDKHKIKVQYCDSPEGEYIYKGKYRIDGFVRRHPSERDLAIEVFGCYWHGCPIHYPLDDQRIANGETAGAIRRRDEKRIAELQKELDVKIKWECEIKGRLARKEKMQDFFAGCMDTGPIDIHEEFFGGRTCCERIYASVTESNRGKTPSDPGHRTIKYKDFVSLYPFINFSTAYPVKHAKAKVYNGYNGIDVCWYKPSDVVCPEEQIPLRGIIKCFIIPPLRVKNDIPAIPLRVADRLLFPLCYTCAVKYQDGKTDENYSCVHTQNKDRGFVTTITTPELNMALNEGYRVTKLIRAWNWPKDSDWSVDLFRPYIRKFMQIKYEASGWPENCTDKEISEEDKEIKRKQKVLDDAYRETKITLNPDKMEFNPGLRYVSKICLNSLWGRFALRNRLSKSVIVQDAEELSNYLDNDKIEISMIEPLSERNWLICYKTKDMEIVENYASIPVIALWTTANARCHLLKSLWKLNENGRTDVTIQYMDTDSIIYEYETRLGDPLENGNQLGQLNDEYPKKEILEFLCLGPKAYCLLIRDPLTGKEEVAKKCRGIILDYEADARLSFERIREMVLKTQHESREENYEAFDYQERNFRLNKRGEIYTVPITKHLRPTYRKGVLRGWRVVPFGYIHHD